MTRPYAKLQLAVEAKFGKPFWTVVQELVDQGMGKMDIVRHLGWTKGWHYGHFNELVRRNPDAVTWPENVSIPIAYLRRTGETFGDACRRMAAEGYTVGQAAKEIGYSAATPFRYAMRVRGIEVTFRDGRAEDSTFC